MDDCLAWCKEAGLNLILDMHEAPGFAFGAPESNTLFDSPAMQERYVALWEKIARRYRGEGKNLSFELLCLTRRHAQWGAMKGNPNSWVYPSPKESYLAYTETDSRVAWVRDMGQICTEHGIGRALWSYRGISFQLVDAQGKPVSEALVAAAWH